MLSQEVVWHNLRVVRLIGKVYTLLWGALRIQGHIWNARVQIQYEEQTGLSNLISLYDKVTHLVGEEKAVDVILSSFSKVFDTIPNSILLDKFSNTELNRFMLC